MLGDNAIQQLIGGMEKGADLLSFLNMDLSQNGSLAEVKLGAFSGVSAETNEPGKNAKDSYVEIKKGTDNDGLCAVGRLLNGLDDKKVLVEKLAVYMVYTAAGNEKADVVAANKLTDQNLFKAVGDDAALDTYSFENLNNDGQLLAKIVIEKLLDSQATYAKAE